MNKTWTFLSLSLALTNTFADALLVENRSWTGFYVGGNAGYLWSAHNIIRNTAIPSYGNPTFGAGTVAMADSLALLGTNHILHSSNGFIGGGQVGYNAQFADHLVIGLDADLDAINQSDETFNMTRSVSTPGQGTQNANISITKKLDYLGLIKGRLGVLVTPSFLLYGSGAFAYGGATFNTSYSITQTNPIFSPINAQNNVSKILAGWAAGAGGEWMFFPAWGLKVEYIFYNIGTKHNNLSLNQSLATTPPIDYAAATLESKTKFTENTVTVGINYHFL